MQVTKLAKRQTWLAEQYPVLSIERSHCVHYIWFQLWLMSAKEFFTQIEQQQKKKKKKKKSSSSRHKIWHLEKGQWVDHVVAF